MNTSLNTYNRLPNIPLVFVAGALGLTALTGCGSQPDHAEAATSLGQIQDKQITSILEQGPTVGINCSAPAELRSGAVSENVVEEHPELGYGLGKNEAEKTLRTKVLFAASKLIVETNPQPTDKYVVCEVPPLSQLNGGSLIRAPFAVSESATE